MDVDDKKDVRGAFILGIVCGMAMTVGAIATGIFLSVVFR